MANKVFKKAISGILAFTGIFGCVGMFSACETNYPKVEMKIEFNDVTYTLEYNLNRKVAPATVAHFLNLAGNGYYNGLCVHDYTETKMYTGGYNYVDEALEYVDYYTEILKDKYQKDFPYTVWVDEAKTKPTYTLYGEFPNNKFNVENGRKKETFGSLTMFYTDKGDIEDKVWTLHPTNEEAYQLNYANNSATSLFYISLSTGSSYNSGYCTFAELAEGSVDDLESLQAAIESYIDDNYDDAEEFTTAVVMDVDGDDAFVGDHENEKTYQVPNEPITIQTVTVKKY